MNVRKIVARLNAKGMSMGTVGGVPPDLTEADISGAIGMIRNPFNRDMFCAIWCRDTVDMTQVMNRIRGRQRAEVERQLHQREIAHLEEMVAEDSLSEVRTMRSRRIVEKLKARARAVDQLCWPPVGHVLRQARMAVFVEIMHPRKCPECHAAGFVIEGERPRPCNRCDGVGVTAMSLTQRASMFGMYPKAYSRSRDVRPVYEWTYGLVREGENDGAEELAHRLSDSNEPFYRDATRQKMGQEIVRDIVYKAQDREVNLPQLV